MEVTSTPLNFSQSPVSEDEGTPKGAGALRSFSGPAVWLLATTPVIQFAAYDLHAREFISPRNTICIEEENELASMDLMLGSEITLHDNVADRASDAEVANKTRLELLARQYVTQKLSPEEDARLAIVTERVRRLIPRVIVEDFENLERIADEARAVRAENMERRRRLGI